MAIHLGPPVTRRLMRPTRGLGSAPLSRPKPGCALLFGLAPGRVCRVSLRSRLAPEPASSLWHWSSPHGGRALPATLRLRSSDFPHAVPRGCPRRGAQPSDRLADPSILLLMQRPPLAARCPTTLPYAPGRWTTTEGPPAWVRSIASLANASATEFWARGTCAALHRPKPPERPPGRGPERDQLGVLHAPAAGKLLHDELRVEEQVDLAGRRARGPARARGPPPCTPRRCSSGRRDTPRSRHRAGRAGHGRRAAEGR